MAALTYHRIVKLQKHPDIQLVAIEDQHVAGLDRPDAVAAEDPAQPGHGRLQGVGRVAGQIVPPDEVEHPVGGDDGTGIGAQGGQHGAVAPRPDVEVSTVIADDVEVPEHA